MRRTLRLRFWKNYLGLRLKAGVPMRYWIHVASSGELEYAIPLIEDLKRRGEQVLITYYSISAKAPVEKLPEYHPNVCLVVPLPHDGLGFMREFVSLVKQQGVEHLLLMKYELWPGLLWECGANGIRITLANALKPSWFHRKLLHKIDHILTGYASEATGFLHRSVTVIGDTRVERVKQRLSAAGVVERELGASITGRMQRGNLLVCGSIWPEDLTLIAPNLKAAREQGFNVAMVPHEIGTPLSRAAYRAMAEAGFDALLVDATTSLPPPVGDTSKPLGLVVDRKGFLVELYRHALCAYVGGGLVRQVHSVWEPALAGAWVACGPRRQRSPESYELESRGRLRVLQSPDDFRRWLEECSGRGKAQDPMEDEALSRHQGAAARVMDYLEGSLKDEKQKRNHCHA